MRKWITGMLLAGAVLTGCGGQTGVDGATDELMSGQNKSEVKGESQIYTNDDIYLESFECGYIREYQKICYAMVIIENEEQLAYAEKQYGLNEKDTYPDKWMYYPTGFARYFTIMKERYPLEEYNYVFSYDEVSSGGYYYHADKLAITEDSIYFLMDDESYSPKGDEAVAAVMGGFGHVAAVPKEYMAGREFPGAIYPEIQASIEEVPQEVIDIMVAFYTAYFDAEGDADKLQPYLSETFADEVELYHDIEPNSAIYSADDLDIRVIKTQSSDIRGTVGDKCILSLEFRFPDEDSLTYLTTKFVRESSGWKITSYGLEK